MSSLKLIGVIRREPGEIKVTVERVKLSELPPGLRYELERRMEEDRG